jgi:hypothetical protein
LSQEIVLPALLGSHPLGALASFGLLRKIHDWDSDAALRFSMEDDWLAIVHTSKVRDAQELVEKLGEWIGSDIFERLLRWTDGDIRLAPDEFRRHLVTAAADDDRTLADFLTSFAADGAVDGQKGLVKPTAFYMVSGQQSFLGGMREIVAKVRANARGAFEEALMGPWRYDVQAHSLGWDPCTERLHALRHRAPTSEKPVCIGAALVLAFWALPLFPSVANDGKSATIGFSRNGREQYLVWPVWSAPIELGEVSSLLHAGENAWMSKDVGRLRPGIEVVYRSRRAEFGQGYAILRMPEVVATSSSGFRGA